MVNNRLVCFLHAAYVLSTGMVFADALFFRLLAPTPSQILHIGKDGNLAWEGGGEAGDTIIIQRASSLSQGGNWSDYIHHTITDAFTSLQVIGLNAPDGMVFVPTGKNIGVDPDFGSYDIRVDAFYMDSFPVTLDLWETVHAWAITNGYQFESTGRGKDGSHPVHSVDWYNAVKWCNARSEMEGRPPVYRIKGVVYREGRADNIAETSVLGYRLPRTMERRYAARGGAVGQRFPWGQRDRSPARKLPGARSGEHVFLRNHIVRECGVPS